MSLTDFIVSTIILDCTDTPSKPDIVQQLVQRLAADGQIDPDIVPAVVDGVLRRESLASTGIGRGIAVPHTKHPAVSRRLGILGLCRPSVDFNSIDAEPVDLIFLILSPPDLPGQYLRVAPEAEELHRRLRSKTFCDRLRASTSAEGLREILSRTDLMEM